MIRNTFNPENINTSSSSTGSPVPNGPGKGGGHIAPHTSSFSHNDNPHQNNPRSSQDPPFSPRFNYEFSHYYLLLLTYNIRPAIQLKTRSVFFSD